LHIGVPNSGKSEWIDALCVNLARHYGWACALSSFEKSPSSHIRNLLEKVVGKPFVEVSWVRRLGSKLAMYERILGGRPPAKLPLMQLPPEPMKPSF
jgi:hypothetical protein